MEKLFVIKNYSLLFIFLSFIGLYWLSLYSYPLFHSLAEIFSIVIACGIFMFAWNSRRILENNYLLFLGIVYLFLGGLDLIHTLAYKGVELFPGYDANLPTQLWIATRYTEAISLLLAPMFIRKKLKTDWVFVIYSLAIFLLLFSIFYWNIFPVCFIEGKGLTSFKITSEYIISLILLAAMALLIHYRREFDRAVLQYIIWSIITTIISELAFTFYISVYGLSNLIGHFFKIISFYLIYKAIIETGLAKPYNLLFRNLKQSEELLRSERDFVNRLVETAQAIVLVLNLEGRIVRFNSYLEEISGYRLEEVKGKDWFTTFLPERDRDAMRDLFWKAIKDIQTRGNVNPIVTKDGRELEIEWYDKTLKDAEGLTIGLLSIGQDITERKQAEEEREKMVRDLQKALSEVKMLKGILPICASCKKIRDDNGYWNQVEVYIRDHSEAEFSHGICPECKKKLYPGFD